MFWLIFQVSIIQSCPHGINRVLDSLLQSFPNIPKCHWRNKIREISDFVDNRWKVCEISLFKNYLLPYVSCNDVILELDLIYL